MRAAAAAALLCGFAACAPQSGTEPVFRDPAAVLAGTTRFDPIRFTGAWNTVACIGACETEAFYGFLFRSGDLERSTGSTRERFSVAAPGVLRSLENDTTLVVMWVDDSFRTAAVGDAAGTWAAVIDRVRPGGVDRVKAATEVLDFNGWDVSQMRKVEG